MQLLPVIIVLIATSAKLAQCERIAAYKEFHIVDTHGKGAGQGGNADVDFYLKTMERLQKLQEEAMEIRDLYKELIESKFGLKLKSTHIEKSDIVGAPSPRMASEDWVRSPLDFSDLHKQIAERNSNERKANSEKK